MATFLKTPEQAMEWFQIDMIPYLKGAVNVKFPYLIHIIERKKLIIFKAKVNPRKWDTVIIAADSQGFINMNRNNLNKYKVKRPENQDTYSETMENFVMKTLFYGLEKIPELKILHSESVKHNEEEVDIALAELFKLSEGKENPE